MRENPEPEELLEVLGDEYAQAILVAADREPQSVNTLSEDIDASKATIYRRIDTLCELGLLNENLQTDAEGTPYGAYETTLQHLLVTLDEGQFSTEVWRKVDAPERSANPLRYSSNWFRSVLRRMQE